MACYEPDRLARSSTDLLRIVDDLDRRGVGLIMLSMGGQRIDTRSPTGKLMITMLAAIAEFERGLLLERQREGVAKAKQEGKYKGRQPTARAKAAEVIKFDAEGLQRAEIARRTGIGVASVYRVLAGAKKPMLVERYRCKLRSRPRSQRAWNSNEKSGCRGRRVIEEASMQRRDINAADAPAPAGQYTQAVEVTGTSRTLYLSGQVGIASDGSVPEDAEAQGALAGGIAAATTAGPHFGEQNPVKLRTIVVIFTRCRQCAGRQCGSARHTSASEHAHHRWSQQSRLEGRGGGHRGSSEIARYLRRIGAGRTAPPPTIPNP